MIGQQVDERKERKDKWVAMDKMITGRMDAEKMSSCVSVACASRPRQVRSRRRSGPSPTEDAADNLTCALEKQLTNDFVFLIHPDFVSSSISGCAKNFMHQFLFQHPTINN
jgi:hypothetical protein